MLPKNNLQQVDAIQDISVEALVDKTLVQLDKPSNETSDTNIKTEEVITNPETSTNLSLDEANLSIINNSQLRQDSFPTEKDVSFIQTENTHEKPLIICVKSYGDYRYIEAKDICYLQADNNSTDIHLHTGEMITAFKTLKHFEGVMTYPFVRIHNSYIVNIDFVSRIHTGNTVCHIKGTTTKLPFSKSYKENIDGIISYIASGNYLEI
ncbi:MAG: LytTR family transcriptional regulator [Flavobacterium sp.]|nr:LytTR family transcriptional regulator [Flavobacterium sp.]